MILTRRCATICLALLGPLCMAFADEPPGAEPQSSPVLPKIKLLGGIYYPDRAKRLNAQGRILLGFAINDRGRATQITIENAEGNKILSDSAITLLKAVEFERLALPESAVSSQRYRMSVVFELKPCGRLQHFNVPKDAQISVCGSPLGR